MKKKYKDIISKDLISGDEFTKISIPPNKHHYNLPSEVIPEDENTDQLKETLVGMEYDIESKEGENTEEVLEEAQDEDLEYLLSNEAFFDENYDKNYDGEDDDYLIPEEEAALIKQETNPNP